MNKMQIPLDAWLGLTAPTPLHSAPLAHTHFFFFLRLVELSVHICEFNFLQNLKDQILTTNVWLEHEWQDHKFKWDPSEYGGVTELYVPSEHIWLPDIVLYNK